MQTIPCDTIIDAAWVLPVAPENRAFSGHSVCITGERISAFGPTESIHAQYTGARHLHYADGILIPGLINMHTHAAMTLLRGAGEDMPLECWLRDRIWPLENQLVDAGFVHAGTELAIAEMLGRGITTFVDMYFFPEISAQLASSCRIRTVAAFPIFTGRTAWSRNVDECFELGLALHDAYRNDPLIEVAFGPHAPYTVDRRTLERIHVYAQELGLAVHIHLHETAEEVRQAREKLGRSWIEELHGIGLLNPQLQAVHMTQLTDAEIDLLAQCGANVVHCPNSNLKLADGVCPVNRLDAMGVNVAIGTDGPASNNALDVLGDARTASLLAKMQAGNAAAGAATAAFHKATLGGAIALGREADLGSIEPGKLADLAVFVPDSPAALPLYDPFSALLHNRGAFRVDSTWVGGLPSVLEGRLRHIDLPGMRARVEHQCARVRAQLANGN